MSIVNPLQNKTLSLFVSFFDPSPPQFILFISFIVIIQKKANTQFPLSSLTSLSINNYCIPSLHPSYPPKVSAFISLPPQTLSCSLFSLKHKWTMIGISTRWSEVAPPAPSPESQLLPHPKVNLYGITHQSYNPLEFKKMTILSSFQIYKKQEQVRIEKICMRCLNHLVTK